MEQVTQADRDRAVDTWSWFEVLSKETGDSILRGEWDDSPVVQGIARHRIEATRTNDQAKDEEIAELVEALAELWRVIDIAGLSNLARGVQLGQVSWFVKASDAVEQARATLAKHQDNPRG